MNIVIDREPAERDVPALIAALIALADTARRCPYVVARFTSDAPTLWDRTHAEIDEALDDLVGR